LYKFISILIYLFVVFSASNSIANEKHGETWECQELYGNWSKIFVNASFDETGVFGTIQVAGTEQKAVYSVKGFDRRWDFDYNTESNSFNYSLIIKPNGKAYYYDFTAPSAKEGIAPPNMGLDCRQK
jgi:hypothetical protein